MNTDRLNQQQQLFGEPEFITGKKQLVGEPQFVTGREQNADQLTPLYTQPQHDVRNTGQEQLHGAHTASGGDWQKIPIHSGQEQFLPQQTTHGKEGKEHFSSGGTYEPIGEPEFITGKKQLVGEPQQLYPGQEKFLPQQTTHGKEGKEHFSSGGTYEPFGEPEFITGKKQLVGEPQFVTGREQNADQLTPLYTQPQHDVRNTGQEQLHGAHTASGGDWQKIPIHSGQEQLYPGQEQFVGQQTTHGKEGKEHFSSGGTYEPIGEPEFITGKKQLVGEPQQLYPGQEQFVGQQTTHGKEGKEHFGISPNREQHTQVPQSTEHFGKSPNREQHSQVPQSTEHFGISPNREQHSQVPQSTEHVHINPSEQVSLTPEVEHIHIKVGTVPESGLEQVIRVKSDGSVQINTEKVGEHDTSTEHGHGTELKKEHGTEHGRGTEHKDYDTSLTDKGRHHDKPTETETQTIVKIKHEPGTKEGKGKQTH